MPKAESGQEREWQILRGRIEATLNVFGRNDPLGRGDYWLLDENWGPREHQLEFQNLALFNPIVIKRLQEQLAEFPQWRITVRVDVLGMEGQWPGMGLVIYADEISDELQRACFPEPFRDFRYESFTRVSRPNS